MKIGMIGTGRIATRFMPEIRVVEGIEVSAVYNPHRGSAEKFASANGIRFWTDDLEMFEKEVEAVYIASPHQTHYEYARKMLESGKHVLCEKPLCLERSQTEELYALADKNGLILMEAIKTAYCPGFLELTRIAGSGVIGEIKDVEACFTRLTPKETREFQDIAYGGSFTEFGSYVLLPVIKLLGTECRDISFRSFCDENGVDWYTKGFLLYDSAMAAVKTGLLVKSEGQLLISGTKGYILAESPWWLTRKFEVRYEDPNKREVYTFPFEGQGLRYEIEAFKKCIENECKEIMNVTPQESATLAGIMEDFLQKRKLV